MRFLSVCSGIEAASVAWGPLGWQAVAFSEIEPFPCAVLAHYYPDVPNLGDMTLLPDLIRAGQVEAPDILCGGTPCQAFSVAGLRKSLDDARGNLSLTFCEIADAIDHVRGMRGQPPSIIFWENVPGVLSTRDNAFGCFLAGLAGEDEPLQPPGRKWANAGAVYGPARAIAWRVLDAQYFGVAQRRRRVFVVASARKGFDPAAVLFEFEGVRRDTAPSREARKGAACRTEIGFMPSSFGQYAEGVGTLRRNGGDYGGGTETLCVATGQAGAEISADMAPTLNCNHEAPYVAHSLRGEGFDASEDGTGRGTPLVPVAMINMQGSKGNAVAQADGPSFTLNAMHGHDMHAVAVPVGVTIHGTDPTVQKVASYDELAQCLRARTPGNIDNSSTTVVQQPVAFAQNSRNEVRLEGGDGQRCGALSTGGGKPGQGVPMVATTARIRRITPLEADRLMGFPDNYTAIPWRGKPADQCPDGPRYKALGNSWAVPVVRWIGERINARTQVAAVVAAWDADA